MNRAAVSVFFIGALLVGATACGDHEAEPTPTTFVFEPPTATIGVGPEGIDCTVVAVTTCDLVSGAVVAVENTDGIEHRLVGTNSTGGNVFDTGVMQPGDDMTLVLEPVGVVTVTDSLWPTGESPSIDITVTAAPADA